MILGEMYVGPLIYSYVALCRLCALSCLIIICFSFYFLITRLVLILFYVYFLVCMIVFYFVHSVLLFYFVNSSSFCI